MPAISSNLKKNDNYFKLKASVDFIREIKKLGDPTETIDIVSLDKSNKKIGKLIPIYFVDNNKIIRRKTSLIFAKVATTNNDGPTENASNATKNYQCKTTSPESKFDCLISEVTFNEKKVNIITPPIIPTPGELTNIKTQNKYFVIEVEEKHLNKFVFTDNPLKNFEVISKTENNKKYSDLTPLFKILGKDVFIKDHYWLLASSKEVGNENVNSTNWKEKYKTCWIAGQQNNCELYKFKSTQINPTKNSIDFSQGFTKVTKNEELKENEAYALKIMKNKKNIDELKVDNQIPLCSTSCSSDTAYNFEIKNMFFADTSESGGTLTVNAAFILDL